MEDLKDLLEMSSFVVTIITALCAFKFKDYHKPIIKRTFIESLVVTLLIIAIDLHTSKEASIFDIKNLNNYGMIFLVIYLLFISSDYVLCKVDDFFKNSRYERGLFIFAIFLFPIGIGLIVDTSDSHIKFLEDTPAKIIEKDGEEYEIIIPKDTTIVWYNESIINKDNIIKNPDEIIIFSNEQNKIILKKSKELVLEAKTIIYLNSTRDDNQSIAEDINHKYNLDFFNSKYNDIQFASDTNFILGKEVNISLTQDTLVAIYKKIDKRIIISCSVLFSFTLIPNFLLFHRSSKKQRIT